MAEKLMENLSLEDADLEDEEFHCEETEDIVKDERESVKSREYLPSEITDEEYIYMPPLPEDFEQSREWRSGGKWLMYVYGRNEKLDTMWTQLLPLLEDGTLSRLKSSTAGNSLSGVLMGYTPECEDKTAVKKAADAIRKATNYEYIMYYKTNEASESGKYRMHGDSRVTKYMHTSAQSMYERDRHKRWVKISYG